MRRPGTCGRLLSGIKHKERRSCNSTQKDGVFRPTRRSASCSKACGPTRRSRPYDLSRVADRPQLRGSGRGVFQGHVYGPVFGASAWGGAPEEEHETGNCAWASRWPEMLLPKSRSANTNTVVSVFLIAGSSPMFFSIRRNLSARQEAAHCVQPDGPLCQDSCTVSARSA